MLPRASQSLPPAFSAAVSGPRLILLVSPTCPVCLAGVGLVLDALEAQVEDRPDVFVVWLPVLAADDEAAAVMVADSRALRPYVTHYWDDELSVSTAAHVALDFGARGRQVAWDLYLFYRAESTWLEPFPAPDRWLHQLYIDDQPSLDGNSFLDALCEVSSLEDEELPSPLCSSAECRE